MGLCDPKAIRNGKAWADVVNQPGYMRQFDKKDKSLVIGYLPGKTLGTAPSPHFGCDNTYIEQHKPKE